MSAALAISNNMFSSVAVIGRSFVLGLPDRMGAYHVGLGCDVWQVPAGSYATGDRVMVVAADNGSLQVERIK